MSGDEPPIQSLTGSTRSGSPLAITRSPGPDLAPWFYWISIAEGTLPPDLEVKCGVLGDHPCIRILFGGTWTAETVEGPKIFDPGPNGITLYFGAQTKLMPISVTGSYKAITLHFRAGAPSMLGGPAQLDMVNNVLDYDVLAGRDPLAANIPIEEDYDAWFNGLTGYLRRFVERYRPRYPDPVVIAFERACLARPDFSLQDFAAEHRVSRRTLERICRRDLGLSPQKFQRRARALDMAASLLGVVLPEEEAEMHLRYFDQPHLTREIRHFFGLTPKQLANGPHPFLRLTMESRQSRRLDALEYLKDVTAKPWRDPSREPRATKGADKAA